MPSPFMISYFAIFLLTIAFVSRGGYIGDINSLESYVAAVVGGRLCSVDYFCFFARLRSSVTQLMKKSLKYHSDTKIHVFSNNSKNQTTFPSPIISSFTCRIAIGGVVAGGMWRSLLRGARQPFPQVFADLSFWGCASLLR